MLGMILGRSVVSSTVAALVATSALAAPQPVPVPLATPTASVAGFNRPVEARDCADAGILKRIVTRFRHQVTHVPNLPDVDIVELRKVHQHRNYVASEQWPIPRRYCGATAQLSDGRTREVWYLIEGGQGFASAFGDNVEFCVSGFDRWYVYNGRCRVLR
jgi:hypothetical protein